MPRAPNHILSLEIYVPFLFRRDVRHSSWVPTAAAATDETSRVKFRSLFLSTSLSRALAETRAKPEQRLTPIYDSDPKLNPNPECRTHNDPYIYRIRDITDMVIL